MALRRPLVFWATCGVTSRSRMFSTKFLVSEFLSPPNVAGRKPSCLASSTWRTACLPLGGAGGGRHLEINHQPVPILHQRMPHEHQLGLLAPALAEQARVWVGGALVCRVGALLTMEVHAGVARIIGRLISRRLVFGPEALETGRGFNQRAVDGEVLVRQETECI